MASRVPTFKEFWAAYPRKRGKDKAEKVWKGMRPEAKQLAFAALPAYIDDYQRNNVAFMYPQGWLNQKRWRDYMEEDADVPPPQGVAPQTPCAPLKSGTAQGGAGGSGTKTGHSAAEQPNLFDQPTDRDTPSLADMETW